MRNLFWSATILMGVLIAACGDDDSGSSALCPPEMVRTRAGEGEACIDALEFSNEQYEVFLNENGNLCEDGGVGQQETWVVESGFENHPVVQVSFYGAVEACESLGKVLCGEDAWQAACAGPGGSVYPYGDDIDPDSCNGSNGEDGAPE